MHLIRSSRFAAFLVAIACASVELAGCIEGGSVGGQEEAIGSTTQALAGDGLVISQLSIVQNSLSTYNQIFVELFNRSDAPVPLLGLSIQLGTATANFGATSLRRVSLPDATIPAGGYYLVTLGGQSGPGAPVPADLHAASASVLSATVDKIAIVRGTSAPNCGSASTRCSSTSVVDMVGYELKGASPAVSDFEGTAVQTPDPAVTVALFRKDAGCRDTNDNAADFELRATAPRSSASPVHVCDSADADTRDAGDSGPIDGGGGDGGVVEPRDGLVISQVYGGATSTSAVNNRNFIELFNRSRVPLSLGGLSVQYQSGSGNFDETGTLRITELPNVTLPAGGYYLIGCNKGTRGADIPPVDLEAPATMPVALTGGKVVLARGSHPLSCGASDNRCSGAAVVDLVGHGAIASDYEGSGYSPGAFQNASMRRNEGCEDSNDNARDFVASAPAPRNSTSPINFCDSTYGNGLVISQVHGTGGFQDALYKRNFIELFNRSNTPISLLGLALQYGAVLDFSGGPIVPLPDTTVPPGGYFLVGFQSTDSQPGADFLTDLESSAQMYPFEEKVALTRGTTSLGCGGVTCSSSNIIDIVGIDTSIFPTLEGNPTPPYNQRTAAIRKSEGCVDTDNNAADFEIAAPAPRNAFAYPHPCDPSIGVDAGTIAPPTAGTGLVISQVYAGGGSAGAPMNRDYVELFNRSPQAVSLAGLALQYADGDDDFGSNPTENIVGFPDVMISGESYFLVGLGSDDFSVGAPVRAETTGRANLAPGHGKVALARTRAPLGCGGASRCPATLIVDMLGYGAASDFEGKATAPALDGTKAMFRNGRGCADSNDNSADFTADAPAPRTRVSPSVDCALPELPEEPALDAGTLDAGRPIADGGSNVIGDGGDASSSADSATSSVDAGCSCRAGAGDAGFASRAGIGATFAALGLVLRRRKRRH